MRRFSRTAFILLLVGVMLILCSSLLFTNLQDLRDMRTAAQWETTSGVYTILPSPRTNIKIFAVEYLYQVDGEAYHGTRVYFFDRFQFTGPDDAYGLGREWVTDKNIGDPVTVYYNPQHPDRAVLNIGWYPKGVAIFMATSAGVAAVVLGPALLIFGYFVVLKRFFKKLFSG